MIPYHQDIDNLLCHQLSHSNIHAVYVMIHVYVWSHPSHIILLWHVIIMDVWSLLIWHIYSLYECGKDIVMYNWHVVKHHDIATTTTTKTTSNDKTSYEEDTWLDCQTTQRCVYDGCDGRVIMIVIKMWAAYHIHTTQYSEACCMCMRALLVVSCIYRSRSI